MKGTGIVRRIDDLGRVVVPKELRKSFGIKERDPIEIFTDGDLIVLKKYQPSEEKRVIKEELQSLLSDMNDEQKRIKLRKVLDYLEK
ncbi:AbrB/MazE/SpoVT family DNA-binding domain-containing protein [Halobacillus sp. A5]|uniref:AbrB/MazE/SpoVT family DNA-binding domain-containing protein n=1 Tax=Halobacillus sp. A5 TaxID=2880263 RepID=UPI0020A6C0B1|nr:AbrB/MazE/SpoVT family DNA-binding domain-containing protein [Halobacillus sp. A5]MCP3026640.1 AbrB/MazE/SpoVT family DNA-binding domain-containing protein [Halobacillus sp. A5]